MEAHDNAWREHIEDNPVILSGVRHVPALPHSPCVCDG